MAATAATRKNVNDIRHLYASTRLHCAPNPEPPVTCTDPLPMAGTPQLIGASGKPFYQGDGCWS